MFWFIQLESLCKIQLLADAAAAGRGIRTKIIGDAEAKFTYGVTGVFNCEVRNIGTLMADIWHVQWFAIIGSDFAGWAQAQPYFDVLHEETSGAYLQ